MRASTLWPYQEKKPRLERGDTARLTAAACRYVPTLSPLVVLPRRASTERPKPMRCARVHIVAVAPNSTSSIDSGSKAASKAASIASTVPR